MLNRLKYKSHKLLFSNIKIFILILFYIIIIFIHNLDINNINIIDCMKSTNNIAPNISDADKIRQLEFENLHLRERIALLERELNFNIKQRFIENIGHDTIVQNFEKNQICLAEENNLLREQIIETESTIKEIAKENMELKADIIKQLNIYSQSHTTELEMVKKRSDEFIDDLINELENESL